MNYRIPRLALLVVLLVSMVSIFQGGSAISRLVLAQGPSCDTVAGYDDLRGTPQPDIVAGTMDELGENYTVDSIFRTVGDGDPPVEQTLIQVTLLKDGEISVLPDGTAIIRVDSGGVTLWNCGETTMDVQLSESSELIPVEPGQSQEVGPDGAIFVNRDDSYYVAEGIDGGDEATPAASIQQLSNNLAVDTLPAAQPSVGSRLSIGIVQPFKLCSKGGC